MIFEVKKIIVGFFFFPFVNLYATVYTPGDHLIESQLKIQHSELEL